jgi:hypothetical protein
MATRKPHGCAGQVCRGCRECSCGAYPVAIPGKLARERDRSVSSVIRIALAEHLEREQATAASPRGATTSRPSRPAGAPRGRPRAASLASRSTASPRARAHGRPPSRKGRCAVGRRSRRSRSCWPVLALLAQPHLLAGRAAMPSRPPDSPSGATRLGDRPALQASYLSTPDPGAGQSQPRTESCLRTM